MKKEKTTEKEKENVPKLRLVSAEEVAGIPNRPAEGNRSRSHLTQVLTAHCDEIDKEIERIMRL